MTQFTGSLEPLSRKDSLMYYVVHFMYYVRYN